MNDGTPEPRTPVMIMVETTWEDQSGTVESTRARMENKSPGGACIRLNKRIEVGTKLKIQGQWDRFTGEARYCRQEGRDYLVGIQKDRTERPVLRKSLSKEEVAKQNRNGAAQVIAEVLVENGKKKARTRRARSNRWHKSAQCTSCERRRMDCRSAAIRNSTQSREHGARKSCTRGSA